VLFRIIVIAGSDETVTPQSAFFDPPAQEMDAGLQPEGPQRTQRGAGAAGKVGEERGGV